MDHETHINSKSAYSLVPRPALARPGYEVYIIIIIIHDQSMVATASFTIHCCTALDLELIEFDVALTRPEESR